MKEKLLLRYWVLFLVMILMLCKPVSVFATTTGQKINQAEGEKQRAQDNLEKTNDEIQNLNNERASMQTYLDNLTKELNEANAKLMEIEQIKSKKVAAIELAQDQIEEAKEQQIIRYEEMKDRIKFMYETGSESYLELFFSATSFSDFLNKADYIEMINQYDRKMLDEYARVQEEITKKEKELKQDRETLEILEQEANAKSVAVFESAKKAGESLKQYVDEIREKEEKAYAYEQEMIAKENDLVKLKEQYKEELALSTQSAEMGSRDLSEIAFASGDEALMAAIIECEAGGESYTGKVAVGAVVMNRVRSPLFPNTVLEVIMQKKQFSPVGSGRFAIVLARGANESCYQAARDAMAGATPVGNCLFFRTPIPGLSGQQIGGHIFY